MQEMPFSRPEKRTEQNVIDSQGTLIISHGRLTGGSAKTLRFAKKHRRPCLHIDLRKTSAFFAAEKINQWISQNAIEVLNVAGPKASKDPTIYQATLELLKAIFFLDFMQEELPDGDQETDYQPQNTEEAVKLLASGLSSEDRATIAKMTEDELASLHNTIGEYIRDKFGLRTGNEHLIESCRFVSRKYGICHELHGDDASLLIIRELWRDLQETQGETGDVLR